MTTADVLDDLLGRGFWVDTSGGRLRIAPASRLTPTDREAVRAHLSGLVEELSGRPRSTRSGEPWDGGRAVRWMAEADDLVERLGVDGHHPEILAAVEMVISACCTRDLETVRFAVGEFAHVVRGLAAAGPAALRGDTSIPRGSAEPGSVGAPECYNDEHKTVGRSS